MDEGIFDIDLIHDIRDLNNDLIHYNTTQASFTQEYIEAITKIFESYAKVFDLSYEFRDLAYAIRVLNSKLIELKIDDIDDNQVSMYKMFLDTVGEDLVKWANEILFEQSAKDIHYLDASLLANIAQIDLMMNISEMTIEDDDIFF
jgi:succinate dehydrogenase flavin-adding protein (antitoxin of CptAB toxin-antitoxin module)